MDHDPTATTGWIASLVASLVGGAMGMRRYLQRDRVVDANSKAEARVIEATSKAETQVVEMLRNEVRRLSESNQLLSTQVRELVQANMALQSTVNKLQNRVNALTNGVE